MNIYRLVGQWSRLGGLGFCLMASLVAAEETANIVTVKSQSFGKTLVVSGTVVAQKSVTLSAQIPGRILSVAGKEGDRFNPGAILVTIDETELRAKLSEAQTQEASATAALRNADVQLNREIVSPQGGGQQPMNMMMNPMSMMGGGDGQNKVDTQSQIFAQRTQVEQARMALAQTQTQIQQILAKLRDAKSIAPFSGVIIKKQVEVGDTVQPGQPLLVFADTAMLEIQADIPVRLRPGLQEGMVLAVKTDTSDNWLQAPITNIYPMADTVRHIVPIKIALPPNSTATAGMYAEVIIPDPQSQHRDLMTIPKTAVINKGGLPMVFLVNPQGQAVLRSIRLGQAVSDTEVAVLSGLKAGDRLVTQPRPGMRSGDKP